MQELRTKNAVDVLSFYNNANKAMTEDDAIWQKILFSEKLLSSTNGIWGDYKKIRMQAALVLILKAAEDGRFNKSDGYFSTIIKGLVNLKNSFLTMDAPRIRSMITQLLKPYFENESIYYNNFACILSDFAGEIPNNALPATVDHFVTTNIFCLSMYDIQFCEGTASIEAFDTETLPNTVLVRSAFGKFVMNDIIAHNAKMLLDLSSTMIKNPFKIRRNPQKPRQDVRNRGSMTPAKQRPNDQRPERNDQSFGQGYRPDRESVHVENRPDRKPASFEVDYEEEQTVRTPYPPSEKKPLQKRYEEPVEEVEEVEYFDDPDDDLTEEEYFDDNQDDGVEEIEEIEEEYIEEDEDFEENDEESDESVEEDFDETTDESDEDDDFETNDDSEEYNNEDYSSYDDNDREDDFEDDFDLDDDEEEVDMDNYTVPSRRNKPLHLSFTPRNRR